MKILPNFVDMAKTPKELDEDKAEYPIGSPGPQNIYPYGLCLSLCEEELEKLQLSDDVEAGDAIHLEAIGNVTSVTKTDTDQGKRMRVEIQLTHIALEDEDHDDDDYDTPSGKPDLGKLYKGG